jgi:hypothetical protein
MFENFRVRMTSFYLTKLYPLSNFDCLYLHQYRSYKQSSKHRSASFQPEKGFWTSSGRHWYFLNDPQGTPSQMTTPKHKRLERRCSWYNEAFPAFEGLHNLSDRHIPWSRSRTGTVGQISEPSLLIYYSYYLTTATFSLCSTMYVHTPHSTTELHSPQPTATSNANWKQAPTQPCPSPPWP